MIIVSQERTEIINFENVININITDCKEDGYLISAGFIVGRDDNYRELGYYKTEERAKEVLNDIIKQKTMFEYFKAVDDETQEKMTETMQKAGMIFEVYKMPEE